MNFSTFLCSPLGGKEEKKIFKNLFHFSFVPRSTYTLHIFEVVTGVNITRPLDNLQQSLISREPKFNISFRVEKNFTLFRCTAERT